MGTSVRLFAECCSAVGHLIGGGVWALGICSSMRTTSTVLSYGHGASAKDMSRASLSLCDGVGLLRGQSAPGEKGSNVILRVYRAPACSLLSCTCSFPRF